MKKFMLSFVVLVSLCCCVHPWDSWERDVSHCEILNDYIDVPLKLQRDVGVVKATGNKYWHLKDLDDPLYEIAIRQKTKNISDSYIDVLKKSSVLSIDSFRVERIYAGPIVILAVGKIEIPGHEKPQDFEYTWSDTWELDRAPWDDDSVPEKRILKLTDDYTCVE